MAAVTRRLSSDTTLTQRIKSNEQKSGTTTRKTRARFLLLNVAAAAGANDADAAMSVVAIATRESRGLRDDRAPCATWKPQCGDMVGVALDRRRRARHGYPGYGRKGARRAMSRALFEALSKAFRWFRRGLDPGGRPGSRRASRLASALRSALWRSRKRARRTGGKRRSGCRARATTGSCRLAIIRRRSIASSRNFRTKEFGFWNSELRIVGVEDIKETARLPWAAQSIPRRFCSGTAVINDGARHPMYYSIAEDTGMIGMDWGVNFCVVGLDRNDAYNPNCRAAQAVIELGLTARSACSTQSRSRAVIARAALRVFDHGLGDQSFRNLGLRCAAGRYGDHRLGRSTSPCVSARSPSLKPSVWHTSA